MNAYGVVILSALLGTRGLIPGVPSVVYPPVPQEGKCHTEKGIPNLHCHLVTTHPSPPAHHCLFLNTKGPFTLRRLIAASPTCRSLRQYVSAATFQAVNMTGIREDKSVIHFINLVKFREMEEQHVCDR